VAGGAVRRRRPLVEDVEGRSLAPPQGLVEDVELAPPFEHLLLERGEALVGVDGAVGGHPKADSRAPPERPSRPRAPSGRAVELAAEPRQLTLFRLVEAREGIPHATRVPGKGSLEKLLAGLRDREHERAPVAWASLPP